MHLAQLATSQQCIIFAQFEQKSESLSESKSMTKLAVNYTCSYVCMYVRAKSQCREKSTKLHILRVLCGSFWSNRTIRWTRENGGPPGPLSRTKLRKDPGSSRTKRHVTCIQMQQFNSTPVDKTHAILPQHGIYMQTQETNASETLLSFFSFFFCYKINNSISGRLWMFILYHLLAALLNSWNIHLTAANPPPAFEQCAMCNK